jgi:3-isopropylmalate dehydratase small subunit
MMPGIIRSYQKAMPTVRVKLHDWPVEKEIAGVRDGRLQLAIIIPPLKSNSLDEMRFEVDGKEKPDFVLNKPAYRKAQILVTGENFGCGSSREHAPWALLDFGIRCVIGTSFADIFYNNCFKNGILPIKLAQSEVDLLMDDAKRCANAVVPLDLETQETHALPVHRARRYRPHPGKGALDR